MPTSTVLCDLVVSSFSTHSTPTPVTNQSAVGTQQYERILGSHPNIIYQIFRALGYYALHCPNRYAPRS